MNLASRAATPGALRPDSHVGKKSAGSNAAGVGGNGTLLGLPHTPPNPVVLLPAPPTWQWML
jgi:hypothetical protein